MAIRIINSGGNSASEIASSFDECIIESLIERENTSFVMDVKNGKPTYKRIRSDEEVSDFIAKLYENDEIGDICFDEETHDTLIYLRELGQDGIEIDESLLFSE